MVGEDTGTEDTRFAGDMFSKEDSIWDRSVSKSRSTDIVRISAE